MKRLVWCFYSTLLLALPHPALAALDCPGPGKPALVAVPGYPFSAVPSGDGCWVFVSLSDGHGHGSVAVLHDVQRSFALVRTVVSRAAFGEALSPDGQVLAVTVRDGVDLLDVSRLEQPAADPLIAHLRDDDAGPVYDIISRDNRLLFVSDEGSHHLSVFNLALARSPQYRGDAFIGYIPTGLAPVGLALSPDGMWLYATSEVAPRSPGLTNRCAPEDARERYHPLGALEKIDVTKAATEPRVSVVTAVPAGCTPVRVAVSPSGQTLWVTSRGDNALLGIPAAALEVGRGQLKTESFAIGTEPVGVAVRPDGKQVWVTLSARFESGKSGGLAGVNGIDGSGHIELMSAPASGFPRNLTFLPDGRTLVVTLFGSRAVEFMPTP